MILLTNNVKRLAEEWFELLNRVEKLELLVSNLRAWTSVLDLKEPSLKNNTWPICHAGIRTQFLILAFQNRLSCAESPKIRRLQYLATYFFSGYNFQETFIYFRFEATH